MRKKVRKSQIYLDIKKNVQVKQKRMERKCRLTQQQSNVVALRHENRKILAWRRVQTGLTLLFKLVQNGNAELT